MINKKVADTLRTILSNARNEINVTYQMIDSKFRHLLRVHGDFIPNDYEVTYTGCDFPITCKVEKCYYDKAENRVMCTLHDVEYEDVENAVFNVPITDLEPYSLYGDNILNLFGQAIEHFTSEDGDNDWKE